MVCVSPATADQGETSAALDFAARAMKVRCNATVNMATVMLDAATLAADLTEALRLRAEGGVAGRLLEVEAQLQEAQAQAAAEAAARGDDAQAQAEAAERVQAMQAEAERAAELHAAMLDEAAQAARDTQDDLRAQLAAARESASGAEARAAAAAASGAAEARRLQEEVAQKGASGREAWKRAEQAEAAVQQAARREAAMAQQLQQLQEALGDEAGVAAESQAREAREAAAAREAATRVAALEEALAYERARAEAAERAAAERAAAAQSEGGSARRLGAELAVVLAELRSGEAEGARRSALLSEIDARTAELQQQLAAQQQSAQQQADAAARTLAQEQAAAAAQAAAHASEEAAAQRQLEHLQEAHDAAVATVEATVMPLQALLCSLSERLEAEQRNAAEALANAEEAFGRLRGEYDAALQRLGSTEAARGALEGTNHQLEGTRAALQARCEEVERALRQAEQRQVHEVAALADELRRREGELGELLLDSRAKTTLLSEALATQTSAQARLQALHVRAAEAERMHTAVERQLRRADAELQSARHERARLEAEVASLQALAAGEIAELEAARAREVGALLEAARAHEAELLSHRSSLDAQRAASSDAALAAEALVRSERERAQLGRSELWQRLKRQAVTQAAEAKRLQASLERKSGEAEQAREAAEREARQWRAAMVHKDSVLSSMSGSMRSAEEAHVRQLVLTGVVATKHGRKGKPHPRHVRVAQSLRRLEWSKPGLGASGGLGGGGGGYGGGGGVSVYGGGDDEKRSLDVGEISEIVPGIATEVARRGGTNRGKEALFLSVLTPQRTLDLEFSSAELRDTWLHALRRWHDLASRDRAADLQRAAARVGARAAMTPPLIEETTAGGPAYTASYTAAAAAYTAAAAAPPPQPHFLPQTQPQTHFQPDATTPPMSAVNAAALAASTAAARGGAPPTILTTPRLDTAAAANGHHAGVPGYLSPATAAAPPRGGSRGAMQQVQVSVALPERLLGGADGHRAAPQLKRPDYATDARLQAAAASAACDDSCSSPDPATPPFVTGAAPPAPWSAGGVAAAGQIGR